jgi:hypothetical protein
VVPQLKRQTKERRAEERRAKERRRACGSSAKEASQGTAS